MGCTVFSQSHPIIKEVIAPTQRVALRVPPSHVVSIPPSIQLQYRPKSFILMKGIAVVGTEACPNHALASGPNVPWIRAKTELRPAMVANPARTGTAFLSFIAYLMKGKLQLIFCKNDLIRQPMVSLGFGSVLERRGESL